MSGHRWSGWPGAWCLDCGTSDQMELAICDGLYDPCEDKWVSKEAEEEYINSLKCPEPGSNRFNPYTKKDPTNV